MNFLQMSIAIKVWPHVSRYEMEAKRGYAIRTLASSIICDEWIYPMALLT